MHHCHHSHHYRHVRHHSPLWLDLYRTAAISARAHICTFEVVGYTWSTITATAFSFTSQEFHYLKKEIPLGNVNSLHEGHQKPAKEQRFFISYSMLFDDN